MLSFNSRNITSGYIKQLLYSFNLPVCRVFKSETECENFIDKITTTYTSLPSFNSDYVVIIKNYKNNQDWFVKIDKNFKLTPLFMYRYGHFYPNLTKRLKLENDLYDSYTHTYLGDYLRFIRDYHDINLMSLYNCYSNEIVVEGNYKYLFFPIKYNKYYSIFTNKNSVDYIITNLVINTRSNIDFSSSSIISKTINNNCMVLFSPQATSKVIDDSGVTTNSLFGNLYREDYLKLIIRLPIDDESAVVVLEGDYKDYKPYFTNLQINYEREDLLSEIVDGEKSSTNLKSNYQYEEEYKNLFNENIKSYNFQLVNELKKGNVSYPIADRLVEYLIGNVITELDPISKNIIDAKKKLAYRYLDYSVNNLNSVSASYTIMDRFKMLDALSTNKLYKANTQDLLGYVDKDIESILDDERYPKEVK